MINQRVIIERLRDANSEIEEFKKREWGIADKEHFGVGVDLARRDYNFCAKSAKGDIVGVIEMNIQGDLANITTLLVDSKERRSGIGRRLVEYVENFALQNNCKKIWLETNEGWVAEKFYNSIGYYVEAKLERHIFGQNSLIFVKFLTDLT